MVYPNQNKTQFCIVMKIKVNRTQFHVLWHVIQRLCGGSPPPKFEAKLLMALLLEINKQLLTKSVSVKKNYTLTFSEAEALAFFIFFKKFHFFTTDEIYEATLVDTICNQIHQAYC